MLMTPRRQGFILMLSCTVVAGFLAGLAAARVEPIALIAPVQAQTEDPDRQTATSVQSLVYAIGSLAVDTEYSAIEIVKLQDRVSRLEVKIEDLQAQLPSGD